MGVRPGTPKPPGSGRRKGSVNKAQRQVLTDKLAHQIWQTFVRLGPDWLYDLAQKRPDLFVGHFLSKFAPPAQKDGEDAPLVALNFNGDTVEAARRIAFALAAGADAQGVDPTVERVPYVQLDPSPQELLRVDQPDPEREQWAQEVVQTPMERLNSETLDERCSRVASAPTRPAWMPAPRVGVPRSKRD